ncbi:MAG: hypothetical protein ACOYI2_11060 [Bacillota bacterium]|nr:hypothetical protein [Clostridia bacterium]
MAYDRNWDNCRDNDRKKKKECNCQIKVKDSIVILICDDVDMDKFKDTVKAFADEKRNDRYY